MSITLHFSAEELKEADWISPRERLVIKKVKEVIPEAVRILIDTDDWEDYIQIHLSTNEIVRYKTSQEGFWDWFWWGLTNKSRYVILTEER